MNNENKKLGRGLSSLFSTSNNRNDNLEEKIFKLINLSSIETNPQQPRKKFAKEELEELSVSIKSKGVLQPILVREKNNNLFEIITGERRWRAAQIAGIHQIPAVIKKMNDEEAMQVALIENIQREDLNPIEEARAYQAILENDSVNYENLSNAVGKSKSHISNTIRLLELDLKIINYIEDGKISMGHARALIGVPNAIELADEIINKKLSVREIERTTSKYKKKQKQKSFKRPQHSGFREGAIRKDWIKNLHSF